MPEVSIDRPEILDLLGSLIDKSLVVAEEIAGQMRYRLLETVRQYAADRSSEDAEGAPIRMRHLDYYLALSEQAAPQLRRIDQESWFELLEAEHDNFRSALAWGLAAGEFERVLRIVGYLGGPDSFWYVRGYLSEGRNWLEQVLSKSDGSASPERILALVALADLVRVQADGKAARQIAQEALDGARSLKFERGRASALKCMASVERFHGQYATALQLGLEAMETFEALDDRTAVADTLLLLSAIGSEAPEMDIGRDMAQEALAIYREFGDLRGMSTALHQLASDVLYAGDFEKANQLYAECIDLGRKMGYKRGTALALSNKGYVLIGLGQLGEARKALQEGLMIRQAIGVPLGYAYSLENFALLAHEESELARWALLSGAAHALRQRIGSPLPVADDAYGMPDLFDPKSRADDPLLENWEQGVAMATDDAIAYALSESAPGLTL